MNRRTVRAYTAALAITSSLAMTAAAQSPGVAAQLDIDNFGRVSPTYYRGAQPEGRDYVDLASLGVRTVINLTSDDADPTEKSLAGQARLRYVQIPMTTHRPPSSAQITEFMSLVMDPASQPVYVHCVGGKHRTGVMTAVYRMTHDGWSADQAFKEMKRYKFGPDFLHPEFKKFVHGYPAILAQAAPAPIAGAKSGG